MRTTTITTVNVLLHLGAFCVAIGSSGQAIRWLIAATDEGRRRRAAAASRTDHLEVHRYGKSVQSDWTLWTLIAAGAWMVAIAGLL